MNYSDLSLCYDSTFLTNRHLQLFQHAICIRKPTFKYREACSREKGVAYIKTRARMQPYKVYKLANKKL